MKYLKGEYCPLCKADLRSETVIKTLNGYKKKVIELYAELKKEMGKDANQVQQVTPKQGNNAFKKAYNELIDRVDYVLEERNGPDFKEVVYSIGGDVITARIMKDGQIYER